MTEINCHTLRFCLLVMLLSLCLRANAITDSLTISNSENVIYLTESQNELIIDYSGLAIFIDSTASLSFEEIREAAFQQQFSFYPDFKNIDYSADYAYWIRLEINKDQVGSAIWLLEFYDQTIDQIIAFVPNEAGSFDVKQFGDSYRYQKREFLHKNFHVIIPELEGTQTFYFKIRSEKFADIRVAVRSLKKFVYYSLNEYFLYGIFYGMILIICFYNMLMYSAIREIKYLYYTFYLLCVAIYAMCLDGIAFQYLWPNSPTWNQYSTAVFLYAVIIGAIAFSRKFLRTATVMPWHDKVLKGLIVARTIYFIIALREGQLLLDLRSIEIIPLGFIFYTGILALMKGYQPARFFVMAYGILFLGFMIKGLIYLNIIPFGITTYYTLHFAFLLEMLFLTFALADRVRILKRNRDRAHKRIIKQLEVNAQLREKVNRELEEKVISRTTEVNEKNRLLEETNNKLIIQSKEINQINSLLDLDNWKLKNNLKEVLKDRVFPKKLSFKEFKDIFHDDIACLKYLYKLKWQGGYECKKCSNDKSFEGSKAYSLRCTKCGYDESVTSHTIFQGVRFPINKAFYILYTVMIQDHKLTIDQLSEMLDLRRNTVWAFKKKIKEAIKNNEFAPEFAAADWQNIMIDFGTKITKTG